MLQLDLRETMLRVVMPNMLSNLLCYNMMESEDQIVALYRYLINLTIAENINNEVKCIVYIFFIYRQIFCFTSKNYQTYQYQFWLESNFLLFIE